MVKSVFVIKFSQITAIYWHHHWLGSSWRWNIFTFSALNIFTGRLCGGMAGVWATFMAQEECQVGGEGTQGTTGRPGTHFHYFLRTDWGHRVMCDAVMIRDIRDRAALLRVPWQRWWSIRQNVNKGAGEEASPLGIRLQDSLHPVLVLSLLG